MQRKDISGLDSDRSGGYLQWIEWTAVDVSVELWRGQWSDDESEELL